MTFQHPMFPPVDLDAAAFPITGRWRGRFTPAGFSLVIAAGVEPLMVWLSFQHSLERLPPPVE